MYLHLVASNEDLIVSNSPSPAGYVVLKSWEVTREFVLELKIRLKYVR